jgi:dTDP-4-amino-4,6-dideoxygalactose transaminase
MKAPTTGNEISIITQAIKSGFHGGDGPFTKIAQELIQSEFGVKKCLLTTSCTDALEMIALLLKPDSRNEIIMPSYTFSSTANAFAIHGFIPVFVDVDSDTKNITIDNIRPAITKHTRAIVVVHYAGITCDMDPIMEFAELNNLIVIEDAAQAVNSLYKGRYAGSIGHLAAYSFHATKAYSCGEGGALLINDEQYFVRSNYLWEKGTDRSLVLSGVKNKYSWVDYGSSFLISDLLASLLYDQLKNKDNSQNIRKRVFDIYTNTMEKYDFKYTTCPEYCNSNYHAFWIEAPTAEIRNFWLSQLSKNEISAYIGYVPLHDSEMGLKIGRISGNIDITQKAGECLIRLPFYLMEQNEVLFVCEVIDLIFKNLKYKKQ